MSKQTAVEWIIEEINQQQKMYINLSKKDKSLKNGVHAILTATTVLKMKCEQAKEMEKHQIKVAHEIGNVLGTNNRHTTGLNYYNETFKD